MRAQTPLFSCNTVIRPCNVDKNKTGGLPDDKGEVFGPEEADWFYKYLHNCTGKILRAHLKDLSQIQKGGKKKIFLRVLAKMEDDVASGGTWMEEGGESHRKWIQDPKGQLKSWAPHREELSTVAIRSNGTTALQAAITVEDFAVIFILLTDHEDFRADTIGSGKNLSRAKLDARGEKKE